MPKDDASAARLSALRERIEQVGERYSQSEIARRTSTSRNNVSRYMRGAKMPLEFGAALSEELGVNPNWLLAGEGTPWLADSAVPNEKLAGDLLALVEAMNAVARMRLGSLTGKHHLRVLRELNDALIRYEELRKELNARTSPIFEDLLEQYHDAIQNMRLEISDDLRKALTQLARLNDDPELRVKFDAYRAHHEYVTQNVAGGIEIQRNVVFHALSRGTVDNHALSEAHNLAMSLYQLFRLKEARRILEATAALTPEEKKLTGEYGVLDGLRGVIEVDMGDVAEGLVRIQRRVAAHPDVYFEHSGGFLVRAQLLVGTTTIEAAMRQGASTPGRNLRIIQFTVWDEDATQLRRVYRELVGASPDKLPENYVYAQYTKALLETLEGDPTAGLGFINENLGARSVTYGESIVRLGVAMSYCRLLRIAGERRRAMEHLHEADQRLADLPEDVTPDVLVVGAHYRNALELIPTSTRSAKLKAMREAGTAFFSDAVAQGFGCFLPYLQRIVV